MIRPIPATNPGLNRQCGALGLLGIVTLLLAVLFTAVAVDSGRLMMEQRRLQTVADMAALDAAARAGNCGTGDLDAIEALAAASAARNNHAGPPLAVSVGKISVGAGGVREFAETSINNATAVHVLASKTVPASLFAGGTLGSETTLRAEAVAERDALAGFSAGSMLLSLSDDEAALLNNLLGGVLGSPVGLDVLSYQGIAATDLSVGELVDASAGIGTVDELLDADLTMAEMLNLYADAVAASDAANVEVANGMDALIAANVSDLTANFGDILAVTTENPEDAAEADVNLMDLITTSALVANGDSAIDLPLKLTVPDLLGLTDEVLNVETELTIIEPPQIAIGPPGIDENGNWRTQVNTAQARLTSKVEDGLPEIDLLGLVTVEVSIDIAVEVESAQGAGWLRSIQCGTINNRNPVVTIGTNTGVAEVNSSRASNLAEDPFIGIHLSAGLLGSCDITLPPINTAVRSPVNEDLVFEVAQPIADALPMTRETASGLGLTINLGSGEPDDNCSGLLSVVGVTVNELVSLLNPLLEGIVSALLSEVIEPILTVLGIKIGAMDVSLISVEIERPEMQR